MKLNKLVEKVMELDSKCTEFELFILEDSSESEEQTYRDLSNLNTIIEIQKIISSLDVLFASVPEIQSRYEKIKSRYIELLNSQNDIDLT